MQVVQHYLFERLQKVFLEIERHELFPHEEFVSQLSQTVNREDCKHQVGVGANLDKMF